MLSEALIIFLCLFIGNEWVFVLIANTGDSFFDLVILVGYSVPYLTFQMLSPFLIFAFISFSLSLSLFFFISLYISIYISLSFISSSSFFSRLSLIPPSRHPYLPKSAHSPSLTSLGAGGSLWQ